MKKLSSLLTIFLLIITGCQTTEFKGTFSYEPEFPQLGNSILVKFNPINTKLNESEKIQMMVYQYDVDLLSTTEIEMKKEEGGWIGTFSASPDTKGALVVFKNENKTENNNGKAFEILLTDKDGNILPEALAGKAVGFVQWARWYLELDGDNLKSKGEFEKLFTEYPQVKSAYLDFYLYTLARIRTDEALGIIKTELERLENKSDWNDKDLEMLAGYYRVLKNNEKVELYSKLISEKFPKSEQAIEIKYRKVISEKDDTKLLEKFASFINEFPNSEQVQIAAYRIIRRFIDAGETTKAIETAEKYKFNTNSYAFEYSVNKLLEKEGNLQEALRFAKTGVESAKDEVQNPKSKQPAYLTKADWKKELENNLGNMLKLQAKVESSLDLKENALTHAKEAQNIFEGNDIELNEIYANLLVDNSKYSEAKTEIEKYLAENKNSNSMFDLLKIAFTKVNGSEVGFDEYVSKFSAAGEAKLIAKLKSEMINEPSPQFELLDLEGEKITLAELKGKTIIVDFWATWCGPCLRSFPAMQEVNNKFLENENVKFLFVNTWERVENKLQNAKDFINKNNYKLTVLLDDKNEVITKFKVTGIPTKFIIGPDQNIKFKSVGFDGTNEALVKEVSAMIDLASK